MDDVGGGGEGLEGEAKRRGGVARLTGWLMVTSMFRRSFDFRANDVGAYERSNQRPDGQWPEASQAETPTAPAFKATKG